jgi:hypothetical protein
MRVTFAPAGDKFWDQDSVCHREISRLSGPIAITAIVSLEAKFPFALSSSPSRRHEDHFSRREKGRLRRRPEAFRRPKNERSHAM